MRAFNRASRLGPAAAVTLLLVLGAACSSDPEPAPTPAGTPSSTASAGAGPTTAAPGPTATPRETQPPPATTPVPPPSPGGVDSTVPTEPEESKRPVELDEPSGTGTGLTARLVTIRSVTAKAQLPGEVAGPALAITIEVENADADAADLSSVVVNVLDADDAPGTQMTAAPSRPLAGRVGGRKSARGVYLFTVPKDKRNPITVTVSIADAPVLVFTGRPG